MNIAIFTDTYIPQINGVVTSTITLKRELEALGHTVFVFAPSIKQYKDDTSSVFRFTSLPYPFLKEHRIVLPLSRQLKNFSKLNIDIIHVQTPFSLGLLGLYFGKRYGIPIVHTYHTYFMAYLHYVPFLPKKILEKYAAIHFKRFCMRCDYIIVPSKQMQEELYRDNIEKPISILPTGVTVPVLNEIDKRRVLKDYSFDKDTHYFSFVGRLAMEKNLFFLLRVFDLILKKMPNAKLLIIGDGPIRSELENMSKYLGISEQTHFTGYIPNEDVFYFLEASDLLLFPSKTETQGLIVLESFCFGTPAICLNQMGVQDILSEQKGGYLVEEDESIFAEKVIEIMKDTALYQEKVQEAKHIAVQNSASLMAIETVKIYQSLCKDRSVKNEC